MEEALSVAALIPTFRRPEELARCLAALAAQQRPPDRVIIVARAEDEPTQRVAAAGHDGLTVERVLVAAPGQVAALNAGLEALREDVVAITDDDCIPRPDWLERIERHFAADPRLPGPGGPAPPPPGGAARAGAGPPAPGGGAPLAARAPPPPRGARVLVRALRRPPPARDRPGARRR